MFIINLIQDTLLKVLGTFIHNWPYLLASVIISVVIKLYVNQEKVSRFLQKYRRGSVLMATAAAVTTPLCSCGTTAVVLGMMASVMPWAPIVAFMVASPLTSPQELVSRFLQKYRRESVLMATAAAVTTLLCSCGTTAVVLGMMASVIPWAPIVAFMVASPLTSPQELVYSAELFGWPFAIAFFVASILLGLLGGVAAALAESRGWLQNQTRLPCPCYLPIQRWTNPKSLSSNFPASYSVPGDN